VDVRLPPQNFGCFHFLLFFWVVVKGYLKLDGPKISLAVSIFFDDDEKPKIGRRV